MNVFLDFETRSKVDLKKHGLGRYAEDPSTEVICYCYAIDDGPVKRVAHGDLATLLELQAEGAVFIAHNAAFEVAIWEGVTGKTAPDFLCTMALVQSHGLPGSLENAAKALQLGYQKDINGARLINKFCKPNKEGEFNELTTADVRGLLDYCVTDVEVERAIFKRIPALSEYEQKIFKLTRTINQRGLKIDTELAEKATELSKSFLDGANDRLKEITDNRLHSLTQTVRLRNYLNKEFELELTSVSATELQETLPSVADPVAREIIQLRIGFGGNSQAKFDRALNAVCEDGRVRNYLIYHGASTGRWTSHTIQLQNLPRGIGIDPEPCIELIKSGGNDVFEILYDDPFGAISSCVRGLFIADTDKVFYVVDYAAIEARVVAWLAGESKVLRMFRSGIDVYVEMAKQIFNKPNLTKKNKEERFLGKVAVLACGYGMGAVRFQGTCEGWGMDVGSELSQKAVDTYRKTNKRIVSFWYDLERAAVACVRTGKNYKCGPVRFISSREFLYCELPSKRRLAYYKPRIEEGSLTYFTQDSQTHSFRKTSTYGGKLCENVTQAVARDIMADAMLELEKENFPIVLCVHDEVVVEKKKGARFYLNDIENIMKKTPEWAAGCPIDVEGFTTERYSK